MTQSLSNKPDFKIHARLIDIKVTPDNEQALLTFVTKDNVTYKKLIAKDGFRIEEVLENLNVPNGDWNNLFKSLDTYVQLAIYGGQARYINQVIQETGRVVFKPMIPNLNAPPVRPSLPDLSNEEADKIFSDVVAQTAKAFPSDNGVQAVTKSRFQELYDSLDSELQLAICKVMVAMAASQETIKAEVQKMVDSKSLVFDGKVYSIEGKKAQ